MAGAKPRMQVGRNQNQVAKGGGNSGSGYTKPGTGAKAVNLMAGNKALVHKSTSEKINHRVQNQVASGKGSPAGQRKAVSNGGPLAAQRNGIKNTMGGIGTPAKMLGLNDGALRNVADHGHKGSGGSNRFDIYSAARK